MIEFDKHNSCRITAYFGKMMVGPFIVLGDDTVECSIDADILSIMGLNDIKNVVLSIAI